MGQASFPLSFGFSVLLRFAYHEWTMANLNQGSVHQQGKKREKRDMVYLLLSPLDDTQRGSQEFPKEYWCKIPSLRFANISVACPLFLRSAIALFLVGGCATLPVDSTFGLSTARPLPPGTYHAVQPGETLWRIARSYGLEVQPLAEANRLSRVDQLAVGQRLFIPLPPERPRFVWPIRGVLTPSPGTQGVEIRSSAGQLVRAARSGRVVLAAQALSEWGKTVVLDHHDGYFSVYAGLKAIFVVPGTELRQGMPLGEVGHAPLHFEVRHGATPQNTIALLPPT